MDLNRILKTFSFLIMFLIIVSIFSPVVKSLPFLDEIKSRILNNDDLKSLHKQFKGPLGFFSKELTNLQKTEGFDFLEEPAERAIKSSYDRLQKLFIFPFNHPIIQETKNESEIYKGDCQAPDICFKKIQGSYLCTICEEDMACATEMINLFQDARNASELVDMGEKCKPVLNKYLFNYALTYILITKFPDVEFPSIIEVFPEFFIKKDDVNNINNKMVEKHRHKRMTDTSDPVVIHVRPTFDSTSLTYFTEDYGYNSNHWNWHIIHRPHLGIDRRGELFWYMHHQMLARYDIERLSLEMNRVESTGPLNRTLTFGYSSNLDKSENGQEWAPRQDYIYPTNIRSNGEVVLDIDNLKLWHTRLSEAAKDGYMLNENDEYVLLSDDDFDVNNGEKRGIDIFTGAAEADPAISPDISYYGSLHNHGHRIISKLHDPETEIQGFSLGVMASAAVSARDPAFYEWHKYVEAVIQDYKITQSPYRHHVLELKNVEVLDVQIGVDAESLSSYKRHIAENIDSKILEDAERIDNENEYTDSKILEYAERFTDETVLLTGCNTYSVDISRGIDFGHRKNKIIIEFTHLDHVPFYYNILVQNKNQIESKNVTVRIFLAPSFDSKGEKMELHEQQHLFIILDKFRYTLSPGENVIHRLSTESSITSNCRNSKKDSEQERFSSSGVFGGGHCGCGWPHHLLLPRGKSDGMMFQIFVLLSDGDEDYVQSKSEVGEFCGKVGEKYPWRQPMGYPFDRPFDRPFHLEKYYVNQLADYLTNAHVSDVSIRFTGINILTDEVI